ncbi:MAG: TIGR03986 family CRISPR-associated RAMP protein [Chromatiaceae bacterium]|nr:TIGR03986 family CRISPR-associated RAMP protein [Chromatiaceae bacterium]
MNAGPFVYQMPVQATPGDDRKSTAPYNFVPLPERVVLAATRADELPRHDRFVPDGYPHSGWFDVTLTTETPLYIRAPQRRDVFANPVKSAADYRHLTKNIPDFFHRGDAAHPVIPGHSLRGMLRAIIEIAGYGKVTQVLDRALVYRAVGDTSSLGAWYRHQTLGDNKAHMPQMRFDYPSPRLRGGFLRQNPAGGWRIEPGRCDADTEGETLIHVERSALPHAVLTQLSQQTPVRVFVSPAPRTSPHRTNPNLTLNLAITSGVRPRNPGDPTPASMLPAMLVESGRMPNKHMACAIYEPATVGPRTLIDIPPETWDQYVEDRDLHRGQNTPTRPLHNDGDPLFYLVDARDRLVFFGPCQMFRLPYSHAPIDLVPEALRCPLDIDFAEALFGFVRSPDDFPVGERPKQGDPNWALAGRVHVTDAVLAADQNPAGVLMAPLTPHILSAPKPTSFQHYLVQGADPTAPAANAQALLAQTSQSVEVVNLSHYDSPQADMQGERRGQRTVLRGHKRYWHQGPRTAQQLSAPPEAVPGNSKQHTRVRLVAPQRTFTFRVHFQNLSDAELGALCWALHPHGHQGRVYRHSLGMGKPLGMGAIRLEARLTRIDRKARYQGLFNADHSGWQTGVISTENLSTAATRDRLTQPFETYMAASLGVAGANARLADMRRVGNLLKLMEWPGQQPTGVRYESNLQVWRDRPVLPPPTAFGSIVSQSGPVRPTDPGQIEAWPPALAPEADPGDQQPQPPAPDSTSTPADQSAAPVNLGDYMDTQRRQDAERLIAAVPHWTDVANELGDPKQAPAHLKLVQEQGLASEFIAAIALHHGALLRRWATYGGKKGRACKTFDDWHQLG